MISSECSTCYVCNNFQFPEKIKTIEIIEFNPFIFIQQKNLLFVTVRLTARLYTSDKYVKIFAAAGN